MAHEEPSKYKVDGLPQVSRQIEELAGKASVAGIQQEFFETLDNILQKLETVPLEWGDPEYRTRKQGGLVCRGMLRPLLVRYVVFEAEKIVVILNVKPLPGTHLA